jgi:putative tryptophan/tyrosine transport system substrate-binding protein
MIKRRQFIAGLGGAAAWPLAARAQQPAMPMIGYLSGRSAGAEANMLAAFREGLNATGLVEGQNVKIEFRFADGELDRLPALAADLVRRQPAIIVAVGSDRPAAAARAADANIPIVFAVGIDPVLRGFVASFSRTGGKMTGVYTGNRELTGKTLGLLHEMVPKATTIALLQSSSLPEASSRVLLNARQAAATLGLRLLDFSAGTDREIEAAFARVVEQHAEALLVPTHPFLISHAERIATLAARHGLPAIYGRREFATAGGLVSYGDNVAEAYSQIGLYAGRILKGEKPSDLPVVQVSKLELVINLKTAKALGLTIPETLLATADEVIQ